MRTLTVVPLLLLPGVPAAAMPSDPPIVQLTPADGEAVPANPAGVTVTFTCPAYLISTPLDRGEHGDYDVLFSDGPALAANGRLASRPYGNVASARLNADGATCTALLDTVDTARSPEIAGGTIHWQVSRACTGCGGPGREFSPVRSFVVRPAAATGTLTAPKRLYAGYPALLSLSSGATLAGGTVVLERRAGARWRTLDEVAFDIDGTPLIATLPRGRHALRARVGNRVIAQRIVTVLRPGTRGTSTADDGAYRPRRTAPNATLRLRITGGGTRLTGFRASVAVLCPGTGPGENRFVIGFATLRSARVAPDGTVVARTVTGAGTRVQLTGRLRDRRFSGSVTLKRGSCTGTRALAAVRR